MSTDGGSVWSVEDLYYIDGGDLIADPNNNSVYWTCGRYYPDSLYIMSVSKTTNSGADWTRHNIGSETGQAYTLALDPTNSNIVYCGGYEVSAGAIYKTTNSGGNWSKLAATGLSGYVYDLAIDPDNTDILWAGTSSNLYKSTDAGLTWATTSFSGGNTREILIDASVVDANIIYVGTYSNGVYRSTDAGGSWTQMNDGLKELTVVSLCINPNTYLFAGTSGGSTYRWFIGVGVEEEKDASNNSFVFFAHPNPAKAQITLNFQLTKETSVDLSIYDIQGRLVKVLVSGIKQAGIHDVLWQGLDEKDNRVSAGVYFGKLTVGETMHIQKLIFIR